MNEQAKALLAEAARAHQQGDLPKAVDGYGKLLAVTPDNADAWNNLGVALRAMKRTQAAVACYHRSLAIRPDHAPTYSNLGNALRELGEVDESIDAHRKGISLAPDNPDAIYNLGLAYRDRGQNADAIECFDKTLAAKPDYVDCLWDRALSQLLLGDFDSGFAQYEWRWHLSYNPPRGFAQALWDGNDLTGKTILLHHEQGYGDSLQFIRFVPAVKAKGGTVVVECQPELARLFETVDGVDTVIPAGQPLPRFDVYAPFLSLGTILGVNAETIPTKTPYLSVPDGVSPAIAQQVANAGRTATTVGIVWGGKPTHRNDFNRSCSFQHFLGLSEMPSTRIISLQKGPKLQEMGEQACPALVADLGSRMGDFADTAAVIKELDLVITVDTAVAHLAGALGKDVWVLIPYAPDWRWMIDRPDSPWYPTMRLFRQSAPGDWEGVFDRVKAALKDRVAKRP